MAEQDTLFGEPLFLPEIVEIDYSELRIEYNSLCKKFYQFLVDNEINVWGTCYGKPNNWYEPFFMIKIQSRWFKPTTKLVFEDSQLKFCLTQCPNSYLVYTSQQMLKAINQITEYKLKIREDIEATLKTIRG